MLTQREARTMLRERGLTLRHADGEFRVAFRGQNGDGPSYYTSDLDDAVATGIDMAERAAAQWRAR